MALESIRYRNGKLEILDQLLLPARDKYIVVKSVEDGWNAINRKQVLGAPAIAIVGCLSLACELYDEQFTDKNSLRQEIEEKLNYLALARPAAVSMKVAANELIKFANELAIDDDITAGEMKRNFLDTIEAMLRKDIEVNKAIGTHGAQVIAQNANGMVRILTHSNTGSLATAGYGTALGVVRKLFEMNRLEQIYCTETRPSNEGARLTAFELVHDKLPATMMMITDSMVAALLRSKNITAIVVGANCVAANGDTANAIGTYQQAVIDKHHNVPFYIATPLKSIDLKKPNGDHIAIGQRPDRDMTHICEHRIAAYGIECWNPSLDVTPAHLITGIITEYGVFKPDEIRQKVGEITKNMVPAPIQSTNELVINEHSFDHQFFYPKNDAQAILQNANEMMLTRHLESFPTEILENICIASDDIGLLNFVNTCDRFEAIAKNVFAKRYTNDFFVINDESLGGDPEIYAAQFNHFGSHIKAIQLNNIGYIDSNHWVAKIIQPYINQIEKLTFNKCSFTSNDLLSQSMNKISHLVLRDVSLYGWKKISYDLPECHNLIELEIHYTCHLTKKSLKQMIHNNPAMQRLILNHHNTFDAEDDDVPIISLIADLQNIKELALAKFLCDGWNLAIPDSDAAIDKIVNSFKCLESLSITRFNSNVIKILQRLSRESNQLKHLGLFSSWTLSEVYETICSFQQIESLHLLYWADDFTPISLSVERLPNLRHLNIELLPDYWYLDEEKLSNVLPLLLECRSLQQITIILKYTYHAVIPVHPEDYMTTKFIEQFFEIVAIAGKSNARIELKLHDGRVIGSAAADGIIFRNRLTYWMDCDKNDTKIRLLDLSEHSIHKSDKDTSSLLDKICDYLDMASLATLAATNKRSKQLVNSYVIKHLKSQKPFIMTNKHQLPKYIQDQEHGICHIFNELKLACAVTNMHVHVLSSDNIGISEVMNNCELLDKLSVFETDRNPRSVWPFYDPLNILHVAFESSNIIMDYSKLIGVIRNCPKIETIEFKNAGLFNDIPSDENNAQKFGCLKKFTFNYRGETQMKNLKKIFENTGVQLVPIFKKLA